MNSEEQIKKYFLIGAGILLVFIFGGLGWAILSDVKGSQSVVDSSVSFDDNQNPSFGPADAKVTVRIYSDFQCPACRVAEQALEPIRLEYQDRVRFIWNDMPLIQIHQQVNRFPGLCYTFNLVVHLRLVFQGNIPG